MKRRFSFSIILLLALMLVFVACGDKKEKAGVETSVDVKSLIANDSMGFVVFNFSAAEKKGLFDELLTDPEVVKGIEDLKKKAGLDIRKDLDAGIFVLFGDSQGDMQTETEMYGVVTGSFDKAKIIAAIEKSEDAEVIQETVDGRTLYYGKTKEGEHQNFYMTFIGSEMIVLGPRKDLVLKGCNVIDGKVANITENEKMLKLYDKVDRSHMFWALFNIPESEEMGQQAMIPGVDKIRSVYIGGSYEDKSLTMCANLFTPDEASTKKIAESLEKTIGMLGAFVGESPELMELIDSIKISQETDSVEVRLMITKEQMDSLKDMQSGMMGGPSGGTE